MNYNKPTRKRFTSKRRELSYKWKKFRVLPSRNFYSVLVIVLCLLLKGSVPLNCCYFKIEKYLAIKKILLKSLGKNNDLLSIFLHRNFSFSAFCQSIDFRLISEVDYYFCVSNNEEEQKILMMKKILSLRSRIIHLHTKKD